MTDQEFINETVNNWKKSLKDFDHPSTRRLVQRQIDEIDLLTEGGMDIDEEESFRSMYPDNFDSFDELSIALDNLLWS
tara:strand:+ start:204 stop:437 length:234 start_codon:yes stop_codon:yes gene_type:complete